VTNPEISAVRDADRVIGILEAEEKHGPALIINRLNPILVKQNDMLSAEDVVDLLGIAVIGIVPEDQSVIVSSNHGTPVAQDARSRAGQAFCNIAKRLQGHEVPFLGADKQGGLWDRLQKMTGRR